MKLAAATPIRTDRAWSIRQLCREFAVTPRALRFYEDKGLLEPGRAGVNRVYSGRDRARLQLILRGRRVGLSLAEIGELLALYDREDGGATQMAASLVKFQAQLQTLRSQRDDLDAAILQLEQGCQWLEDRLASVAPDRLPQAGDYDTAIRARLDAAE
jgi:DNA-binding transcriptional MerR regulator